MQEFDLPFGESTVGRSSDCLFTIDDPLVSRRHARFRITEHGASVEDMGSRNGIKVNGSLAKGSQPLKDGDRVRIGTHELLFCEAIQSSDIAPKITGFLRYCAICKIPYAQEAASCPNCGSTEQLDEDTLNGQFSTTDAAWGLQLLIEVTEKAIKAGRPGDALRMFARLRTQVEERLSEGSSMDPSQLTSVATTAHRVFKATGDEGPVVWSVDLYNSAKSPPESIVVGLWELEPLRGMRASLETLAKTCELIGADISIRTRISRLAGQAG